MSYSMDRHFLQRGDSSTSASFTSSPPSSTIPEGPGFPASGETLLCTFILAFVSSVYVERQKDKWLALSTHAPLALDTVVAPAGVGWAPQFRSISGPEYVREAAKESTPPPPKRSRSPPPSFVYKPSQDPLADPRPKSVPPKSPRTRDAEDAISISSPSSPQPYALSVSGYQVRGLWTKEKGTQDSEV
ncbi:hypothetical protein BDR07DRAFT_1404345 [Suillus spraguei]|nr:hypothetical protein BDR07DRAFT_1404345 [Suillus spraguei]